MSKNNKNPKGKQGNMKSQTGKDTGRVAIIVEDHKLYMPGNAVFDMGKIIDSNVANQPGTTQFHGVTGTNTATAYATALDTGSQFYVCVIMPSIGGRLGSQRSQLAFRDQFINVVGDAYYSSNITEVDLEKLFFYCEGLGALVVSIDRALGLGPIVSKYNQTLGFNLLRATDFDFRSIVADRQRWIDARNRLVDLINDKFYLADTPGLRDYYYLLNHIFVDQVSQKAQPILFKSPIYANIDNNNGDVTPIADLCDFNGAMGSGYFGLSQLHQLIQAAELFSLSAWYNSVAPILHHLYGSEETGLYKFSHFEDYTLAFTFDYNVVNALRNSKFMGMPRTVDASLSGYAKIYEDAAGYIRQGGDGSTFLCMCFEPAVGAAGASPIKFWNEHWINVDGYPSDDLDKNQALAFYCIEDTYISSSGTQQADYATVEYSGHILFLGTYSGRLSNNLLVFKPMTNNMLLPNAGMTWTYPVNMPRCWATYAYGYKWGEPFELSSGNIANYKIIIDGIITQDTSGNLTNISILTVAGQYEHDKDNRFLVKDVDIVNYYVQQAYDQFVFPVPSFKARK